MNSVKEYRRYKKRRRTTLFREAVHVVIAIGCLQVGRELMERGLNNSLGVSGYLHEDWEKLTASKEVTGDGSIYMFSDFRQMGERDGEIVIKQGQPGVLGPRDMDHFLEGLKTSNYADTLKALFGQTEIERAPIRAGEGIPAWGEYSIVEDKIFLATDIESDKTDTWRFVLAHEMAHAWQTRQGAFLSKIWDKHNVKPPRAVKLVRNRDKNSRVIAIGYASRSRAEHQAEAVAGAIGYLDILAREDFSDTMKESVGIMVEEAIPGSILLTRIFLTHPIYANHPGRNVDWRVLDLSPLDPPEPWEEARSRSLDVRAENKAAARTTGLLGAWLRRSARKANAEYDRSRLREFTVSGDTVKFKPAR